MTRIQNSLLIAYFMLMMMLAPFHLLSFDSYYYWEWSRHLALSYYDGPPMIAYLIKAFTWIFGHNLLALNALNLTVCSLTCVLIYKTARLFMGESASCIATLAWIFSPLVTLDLINQTTLNSPLTLFWALSVYYITQCIKSSEPSAWALCRVGFALGLMLLSKYSAVTLAMALMLFLLSTRFRYLFKNPALYLAICISGCLFAPVLIWNYQHDWQSFYYQLSTHTLPTTQHLIVNSLSSMLIIFIPSLNFLLLPLVIYVITSRQPKSLEVYFCFITCMTILVFYALIASFASVRCFWLQQYLITGCLLLGYFYQTIPVTQRYVQVLIILYALTSLAVVMNATTLFNVINPSKMTYYHWFQRFNRQWTEPAPTVVTTGWFQARMLFFLKNHPTIQTINCGLPENQYTEWNKEQSHMLQDALYIDTKDHIACINPHFKACEPLNNSTNDPNYPLIIAYRCTNR